mgnify:CR=1 FL=1
MQITNVGYKQFKSDKRFAVARPKYIIQINLKGKRKEKKTTIQVLIITKVAKHTI